MKQVSVTSLDSLQFNTIFGIPRFNRICFRSQWPLPKPLPKPLPGSKKCAQSELLKSADHTPASRGTQVATGCLNHGGAIHSTKISGTFGPKLNGSVRSNRKSFEKTGPPFEVVLFSRSDRSEFWLNGSRPFYLLATPQITYLYSE